MKTFYGQFNPPVDKILYEKYFENVKNGVSIEAGALDGIWDSSTYFFKKNLNWKTINIEPLPNMFAKLEKNRKKSINLNIALSNHNNISIIKNYKHPTLGFDWGNASLSHTNKHRKYLERLSNNIYKTHKIKSMTYTELIKELNIKKLDLFVLDVEGHEDMVIEGMKESDVFPQVFVIEHGHRDPNSIYKLLKILPVKYKLDHVFKVNSYFCLID
uniref:Methyltransferase n=1 Tax=Mimivirus LCMiAC01 TaxID=2506608 RepID=A0A481Z054_9VIRU|nr:MAG: methyltransferase [Mimivirus LCMiAC01]